jgi:hypothetical protein
MRTNFIKIVICSLLLGLNLSCGHNNNQSEGAADATEDVSAPSPAAQQNAASEPAQANTATDTISKGKTTD